MEEGFNKVVLEWFVITSGLAQQPPKRDREGRVGTQAGQGFGEKEFEVLGRLGTRDRSRT